MTFKFPIPGLDGDISIEPGSSVVFVGANGSGKTRLAVYIESKLDLNAHRISAHRALTLNPRIAKINEQDALSGLRTGYPVSAEATVKSHRQGNRWQGDAATSLLNDFDFLAQALFADQANLTLENHQKIEALYADPANITQETHQKVQALYVDQANGGDHSVATLTKFRRLVTIWERLLPDRQLHISGDNIQTSVCGSKERYQASEMSDGERAIFYMIGQTLTAASDSILIFDEPELHVHSSIMAKVWDELEAARQDCAFVFITHDLEFAASRVAQKFIIRDFDPSPHWTIDKVPENTGFDDAITTLILGSRQPILFVEGHENSLDQAIYRCCFPGWTVIPRGSCQEVIHSVVTMSENEELTRVICSGIVDADDRQADDITYLDDLGIAVLPVSEIENIILLPPVSRAIAKREGHKGDELEDKLNALKTAVFETLTAKEIDAVVMRYCRRRIDRFLKHIDLSEASTVPDIKKQCDRQIAKLDIEAIAKQAKTRIEDAVRDKDLPKLLANYDNKGLMALAAKHLRNSKLKDFESWFTRILRNNIEPALVTAINNFLPKPRCRGLAPAPESMLVPVPGSVCAAENTD